MENRARTKDEWLRAQEQQRHHRIVAVNAPLALTPSLYFGTRRCTYSDVVSVVTTVKPVPRFVHDAKTATTHKSKPPKHAWEAPGAVVKASADREAEPPPFNQAGNGAAQYVQAPLEGESERERRFLARQAFALTQERTAFLAALHEQRKARFLVEQAAALVVQRVYRGFLLRRRFVTIKEKLRVRKRIRQGLVQVTKGTAIITGEKERKARLLARQHDAARRLQFAFRRWLGRRILQRERVLQAFETRQRKARVIQRQWRKCVARAVARKLRARLLEQRRQQLAWLLARVYRGYCARQRVRRMRLRRHTLAAQRLQDFVQCVHARKALALVRRRRQAERAHLAARAIQRRIRGVLARARVLALRVLEDRAIRVACALAIQRVYRGFCGRTRVRFLRVFRVYARAWRGAVGLTRIVRGFLARRRVHYERLEQETDLLVQTVRGNTSTVIDLLDGYGLVDEPVELTTTNLDTKNHTLHLACRHGRMEILTHVLPKFLEQAPELIYARNAQGLTPLELAIVQGHEQLASFLLTKTPELFLQAPWLHQRVLGRRERSLVLDAARYGMAAIVAKLVMLFPQLFTGHERDAWSQRALLHEALLLPRDMYEDTATALRVDEAIHATLVGLLAKLPLDVNAQDVVGFTPLHLAAMQGNLRAVETLLAHGADVGLKDREGRTAWRLALLHGHEACYLAIRRKWLGTADEAADSDAALGRALAQAATSGSRHGRLTRRRRPVVADLQPHLASDVVNAARQGDNARVQFFLTECHASVNARDAEGESLVMVVLQHKNMPLLRFLLATFDHNELDLSYVAPNGRSALDVALQSPRLVERLLHDAGGGRVNVCLPLGADKQHRTACHEAVQRGYDLRAWLQGHAFMPRMLVPLVDDAGRSLLHEAAAFGNVAAASLLLNAGARLDVVDAERRTPLHDACRSGSLAIVRKMVRTCPRAVLWARDAAGQLPVQAAAPLANLELLKVLADSMRRGLTTEPSEAFLALEKLLRDQSETRRDSPSCEFDEGDICAVLNALS